MKKLISLLIALSLLLVSCSFGEKAYIPDDDGSELSSEIAANETEESLSINDESSFLEESSYLMDSASESKVIQPPQLVDKYDLDYTQRQLYDKLVAGIKNFEMSIEIDSFPKTDLEKEKFEMVFDIVYNTHPEFFWFGSSQFYGNDSDGKYYVWPVYTVDGENIGAERDSSNSISYPEPDEIAVAMTKIESQQTEISNALGDLPINNEMSAFELEVAVHDWLYNKIEYDPESPNANSIYGAIVEGRAVCEGFSRSFQYILGLHEIDSLLFSGIGITDDDEGPHMWNAVKLEDEWYHVDVTWDTTTGKHNGLTFYHMYFNRTDGFMESDHIKAENNPNIICTATTYNYYEKVGVHIASDEDFINKMPTLITDAKGTGKTMIELEFEPNYIDVSEFWNKMKLIDSSYAKDINIGCIDRVALLSFDE